MSSAAISEPHGAAAFDAGGMKPTDISDPVYFHKVVDCQWACPAHTPVPEYIRMIAAGRYADAYMVNWHSNVFPGVLGRTCDRPCEPACRRGRVAPRGRELEIAGRKEAAAHIHIGIDWLSSVSFGHTTSIGKRVIVLGGGNTAMDCCRTSRRLGGEQVDVVVRSGFGEMKASPWEKEDAMHEGIPIHNFLVPKEFLHDSGKLTGVLFEKVKAEFDAKGRRTLVPAGEPDVIMECDDVLVAVGQENAFPWIERDIGIEFDKWDMPKVDPVTMQSTNPKVFFGGDAAFGPKNIIWAVAHGHEAAISIDLFCHGDDVKTRPSPLVNLSSQKMGIHEWAYDNDVSLDLRFKVPQAPKEVTLRNVKVEVELGFDPKLGYLEAQRCLNCDAETVFDRAICIECDACVDICPMDCI